MKLSVLIENTACDASLTAEHGLCLLIETGGKRFLLDTGATGAFAENARKLGVDLTQVDAVILSHGHYDHGGGLEAFLQRNTTAPVYVSAHAFGEYYNADGKYIGLPPHLRDHPRLIPVTQPLQLSPNVTVQCGDGKFLHPIEPYGLQMRKDGCLQPDDFRHELYLLVREKRRICITGCAHVGVQNILHRFRPEVLVGGFHFKPLQPSDPRLGLAARRLLEYPCEYYTGHCTGAEQYAVLKEQLGERLHALHTGCAIEIE